MALLMVGLGLWFILMTLDNHIIEDRPWPRAVRGAALGTAVFGLSLYAFLRLRGYIHDRRTRGSST